MSLRVCLFFVILFCFTTSICGQQPRTLAGQATLQELTALASKIYDAGFSRDVVLLGKLLHPDFLEVDARGEVRDKTWNLANLPGENETIIYRIEDAKVKTHGVVSILFYLWVVKHTVTDQDGRIRGSNRKIRVTDTFVNGPDGWKLAASHRSVISASDFSSPATAPQ